MADKKFTDEQFLELYKTGISDQAIAKKLNVHRVSVRLRRVNKFRLPAHDPLKNIKAPPNLNAEGAYIIGALLGDKANISKKYNPKMKKYKYVVSLCAGKDREFAEYWIHTIRRLTGRPLGYIGISHMIFIAYAQSKQVYEYVTRYVNPKWHSLTWRVPIEIQETDEKEVTAAFLRGLFDAEGSVGKYYVTMSIANQEAIVETKALLKRIGINSYIGKGRKNTGFGGSASALLWTLYITHKENLEGFRDYVGFSISRKQEKLSFIEKRKWWRFEGRDAQVLAAAKKRRVNFTTPQIAIELGIRTQLVSYTLKRLKRKGLLEFEGTTRWGKWRVKQNETNNSLGIPRQHARHHNNTIIATTATRATTAAAAATANSDS